MVQQVGHRQHRSSHRMQHAAATPKEALQRKVNGSNLLQPNLGVARAIHRSRQLAVLVIARGSCSQLLIQSQQQAMAS